MATPHLEFGLGVLCDRRGLMRDDVIWRALFVGATAILMLGIMLLRSNVPPTWALLAFPSVGAALAYVASTTSPNHKQNLWLERSIVAAACFVLLILIVNGLLIELLVSAVRDGAGDRMGRAGILMAIALAGGSVLLWLAYQRRLIRFRDEETE